MMTFPLIPAKAGIQRMGLRLRGDERKVRCVVLAAIVLSIIAACFGGAAYAHQVNLSTARVELRPDRTVAVEVALKGATPIALPGRKSSTRRRIWPIRRRSRPSRRRSPPM